MLDSFAHYTSLPTPPHACAHVRVQARPCPPLCRLYTAHPSPSRTHADDGLHVILTLYAEHPPHTAHLFMAAERALYAVHPIPLSDIKALRKHTPTLGWHYLLVILNNGVTLPPLYFHKGGIRNLISIIKQVGARGGGGHS